MSGRVLAFSDPEIIRMARENFVPVAGDDWYQRRRQDAEGDFFRKVSDQAGRGSAGEDGGSSRQGIYCLTASGKLLAFKNAGQLPAEMRKSLRQALVNWSRLPASERRPGAVQVPDAGFDPRFAHGPPPGALVVNVYTRLLDQNDKGDLCPHVVKVNGAATEPQRDHLWLTEAEWKSLIPPHAKVGDKIAVPPVIARRIFQFHLGDSTPGEPFAWSREHIRSGSLALIVEEYSAAKIKMRIEGAVLLATATESSKAERGYDARLLGYLNYDVSKKMVERFDLVAYGECWGKQAICNDKQNGHRMLGVAFELAKGDSPADHVPPQAARWLQGYLQPSR